MDGSRLALVTLLALGLAVYAGFYEASRDASSRSPVHARRVPAPDPVEDPASIRLLAPWEEYEEDTWVSPDEDAADGGARPQAVPPDLSTVPDLKTWHGSRYWLKRWAEREIALVRDASPGTPEALRLGALLRLLAQIREEERRDRLQSAFQPFGVPWPFPTRPLRGRGPFGSADSEVPKGEGLW